MSALHIFAGKRYVTSTGRILTVIRKYRESGSKTRMVWMVEIKWDGEDGTNKITRRMFNKIVSDYYKGQKPEPQPEQDSDSDVESPKPASSVVSSDLAAAIAAAVAPHVKAGIDREQVEQIVDERIVDSLLPRRIEVVVPGSGDVKDVGVQHAYFEALRRCVMARLTVWLVGPAGSGKTSIAASIAESLGLPHYAMSVCATTSKSDLLGYKTGGNGELVKTDLRIAYEHGGVFLLDEIDAGNPNVMVIMNALLANGQCGFPDGMVKRHPDFLPIAGANTIGMGADKQFVGRNKLDEATRDRFVMMELPYDPVIEAVMAGVCPTCFSEAERPVPYEFIQVEDKSNEENDRLLKADAEKRCAAFCRKIVKVRAAMAELKVRHIVSPRATKAGCTLIRLGFTMPDVMNMAVWKGLDADTVSKIESHC